MLAKTCEIHKMSPTANFVSWLLLFLISGITGLQSQLLSNKIAVNILHTSIYDNISIFNLKYTKNSHPNNIFRNCKYSKGTKCQVNITLFKELKNIQNFEISNNMITLFKELKIYKILKYQIQAFQMLWKYLKYYGQYDNSVSSRSVYKEKVSHT